MPDIFDIVGAQLSPTATPQPDEDIFDQVAKQLDTPTPSPTPTAVADTGEGDGFLAKINAALRQPSPEWLQAPEGAVRELIQEQMPHDLSSYLTSLYPPAAMARQAVDLGEGLAQGDVSGVPLIGRIPEIMQADESPAFSKERYKTTLKTLMDLGLLAGLRAPEVGIPSRAGPIAPPESPPPPPGEGAFGYPTGGPPIPPTPPVPIAPPPKPPLVTAIRNLPPEPTLADKIRQPPAPEPAPVAPPIEPVAPTTPELLSTEDLPHYAQGAIQAASRATYEGRPELHKSQWVKQTVPIESLKPGNEMLYETPSTFQPRTSMNKGPIVVANDGMIIDGNNRVYEALKRGENNIEIYREVPSVPAAPVVTPEVAAPAAAPAPPRKFTVRPPFDDFGSEMTPIANYIIGNGGIMSKSTAKRLGLYDKTPAVWENAPRLAHSTHNKIYPSTTRAILDKKGKPTGKFRSIGSGGERPENVARDLYRKGLIPDEYVDTMWQALDAESKGARSRAVAQRAVEAEGKKVIAQGKAFEQTQQRGAKAGAPGVQAKDLQVGDIIRIAGEDFKVIDIDPDTFDVVLEDGSKFGVQSVADDAVIYGELEAGSVTRQAATIKPRPTTTGTGDQIRKAVDSYDFDEQHVGASQLADDLEAIHNLPKPLAEALQKYRDAVEEDRTLYGERSGEPEIYGDRLYKLATEHAAPEAKVQETPLELTPPESDAEMLAREKAEAQANAALQAEAEKKAKVKHGWDQKKTGTTGDLGQGELGGELGGNEGLFGRAEPTQARAAEVPRTPPDVIGEPPPPPSEPPPPTGGEPPSTPPAPETPKQKTRRFSLQLQADTDLIQNLKDKIGNRTYEPIPNKITADQAVNLVDERPIPDVINAIQDEHNGVPGHVRSAMGQIVIKRLNRAAESLGQAGKTMDADIAMNQAVNLAEWMQEFGTRSGQTVQSFAMWSALTPEGKLISVTRKVRKARANHEHENPGEVGEITDALNLPTEAEKIAAFRKLFRTNKTARKVKPRLQKLIEAARTGKLTDQEFYDIASDRLGLPRYDPHVAAEIMRLALEIDKLPEGMPRDQAVFNLNRFIATKMGFRLSDLPMGVYYGNMLSGYNTHIVNALDTFLNVGSELSGMAISNPRSAIKIFRNSLKGFNEGRADALMALTRGRMLTNSRWMEMPQLMEVAKFGEKGGVPPLGTGLAGRIVTKLAESKAGYPLNAWKYVGRLMSASDSIMFRGAKEGRAALLADRLVRNEGLRGKALDRRVQEELGRTTEQETLFHQQAKDEGFSGAAQTARVTELRERSRSMEANADADDFAGIATYNHKPQGTLGYLANKVGEASGRYPALRTIVPFTNIVANVTNRGLNYTPWGFKRAFRGYSGELPPKGDMRRTMLARATMGSTGLGLLYTLQQQGAVEIHGAGPSDPDKRKQLQEAGWKPYSIKMGDHYLSYLPTPLGLGLSILGNMSDVQRYGEMDQKSALLRGTYALSRVGSTIFSQSFLSSLSTLFEALSGQSPGQQLSAWRRLASGIVGTATSPRIVLDVQRIFDPKRYESNTIAGDLLKNTPFSAMVNRPILNAFGEPIEPPTNRFISAVSDDPAWRVIAEANLRVPVPDKYTNMPDGRGGKRQITPEEYYEYLEKSGPQVKQYIMRDTFNLTHMPPDKAQDLLSQKSQEIRERVLKEIRRRAQFTPAD